MKINIDKKNFSWGLTAFLVIAASIFLYYFIFHSASISNGIHSILRISMPIVDGMVLAYLLTPLVNNIEKKALIPFFKRCNINLSTKNKKRMRMLSILLTLVIVFVLIYTFCAMVIPQLLKSIQSIIFQFLIYVNKL